MWPLLLMLACTDAVKDHAPADDTGTSPVDDSTPDSDSEAGTDSTRDDSGPDDSGPDDSAAPASEDCTNGDDDDEDGLLDCEDEDCEDASACGETDCTDGLDEDADGLVDCEDDDCWSTSCDSAAWARVTGGRLRISHTERFSENNYFGGTDTCGFDSWTRSGSVFGWVASASGTVRFVKSSAMQTCTWSTRPAWGARRRFHSESLDGRIAYVTTSGGSWATSCIATVDTSTNGTSLDGGRDLYVEAGCGLTRTDFLPAPRGLVIFAAGDVRLGAQVNTPEGATWYKGATTYTYSARASDHSGDGVSSYALFAPIDPTGTFATLP